MLFVRIGRYRIRLVLPYIVGRSARSSLFVCLLRCLFLSSADLFLVIRLFRIGCTQEASLCPDFSPGRTRRSIWGSLLEANPQNVLAHLSHGWYQEKQAADVVASLKGVA